MIRSHSTEIIHHALELDEFIHDFAKPRLGTISVPLTARSLVQSTMEQREGIGHLIDFVLDRREAGSRPIGVFVLNNTLLCLFQ